MLITSTNLPRLSRSVVTSLDITILSGSIPVSLHSTPSNNNSDNLTSVLGPKSFSTWIVGSSLKFTSVIPANLIL